MRLAPVDLSLIVLLTYPTGRPVYDLLGGRRRVLRR